METIRYHRRLSRSIYIWGLFTPQDFAGLILGLAANLVTVGSNAMMGALLVGYPVYLAVFRLGRAPGHDVHWFSSWLRPRHFRPGREERRALR